MINTGFYLSPPNESVESPIAPSISVLLLLLLTPPSREAAAAAVDAEICVRRSLCG